MLMKKLFNIIVILNKMMTVKFVKLHSQLIEKVKKKLFAVECF